MPVFKLVQDRWNGRLVEETAKESPHWDDVSAAIHALDAETHTLVSIEGWGKTQMMIGGGSGKYVISVVRPSGESVTLLNGAAECIQRVLLKAGGQFGNYPTDEVVELSVAIKAAFWFFEHNEPKPDLKWRPC
jgi:hypothetical protein